jgi:3-hydroxybutyryl-CoA dehydrogenase
MAPPRTIICTPSDTISITDLASCTYRADRCLAVRGIFGQALRILYPASANEAVLKASEQFFAALGSTVTVEADPDLPMLMKNIVYTR